MVVLKIHQKYVDIDTMNYLNTVRNLDMANDNVDNLELNLVIVPYVDSHRFNLRFETNLF